LDRCIIPHLSRCIIIDPGVFGLDKISAFDGRLVLIILPAAGFAASFSNTPSQLSGFHARTTFLSTHIYPYSRCCCVAFGYSHDSLRWQRVCWISSSVLVGSPFSLRGTYRWQYWILRLSDGYTHALVPLHCSGTSVSKMMGEAPLPLEQRDSMRYISLYSLIIGHLAP
jgi:hypothetical protein